jgi:hypothetical protein
MLGCKGQAGEGKSRAGKREATLSQVVVTSEMRVAGAWAIDDLEGAGSLEDKAEAAYRAMVQLSKKSRQKDRLKMAFERA